MANWSTKKLVIQGLEGFILLGIIPCLLTYKAFPYLFWVYQPQSTKKSLKKAKNTKKATFVTTWISRANYTFSTGWRPKKRA